MSILGKIFGRIFPSAQAKQAPAATQPAPTAAATTAAKPANPQAPQAPQTPAAPQAGMAAATVERVDVEEVLNGLAAKNPQKLNWRTSIVDLMKLVGMDSTLQERKELADELGYTGDKSDTAAMNMWLHKAVMRKLEENGGKVPANLMD
jgi:3-oxoacyl-ACP reductase-like protein